MDITEKRDKPISLRTDVDNGDKPLSAREVVTEFCGETTAHGPAHVANEPNRAMKYVWLIVFLCALVGLSVHLSLIIQRYLSRPTQEMTFISSDPPVFPAVTVCNQNPVSEVNLQRLYATTPNSNTSWFQQQVKTLKPWFAGSVTSSLKHLDDWFGSSVSFYENIGPAEASRIGWSRKDFVLDCTYAGIPCTDADWELVVHPMYHNCYTFHGHAVKQVQPVTGRGSFKGLSLVLYLGPGASSLMKYYNRFSPISNGVGARVELHEKDDVPQPDIRGMDVMPGASTSLALRSEIIIKEPPPFGNCTTRTIHATPRHPNLTYTSSLCKSLCLQQYVFATCGCYVASLPYPGSQQCGSFHLGHPSVVDNLKEYVVNMECVNVAERAFNNDTAGSAACDCPPECQTTLYFSSMSNSRWPGPAFHQDFLIEYLGERDDKTQLQAYHQLNKYMTGTQDPAVLGSLIDSQFARVNVYYSDLEVVVRKTVPSYIISQLFCDIGGTLGLWAGVSIITILELLTYGTKIAVALCHRRGRDGLKTSKIQVQTMN